MVRNRSGGVVVLLVFGAIFAIVGYIVAFLYGKPLLEHAKASKEWPSVEGVVERSKVATSSTT